MNANRNRFYLIWLTVLFFLALSCLTRLVLLLSTQASSITPGQIAGIFTIGSLYDLAVSVFVVVPFVLHLWLQNEFIYRKKVFPFVCLLWITVILLMIFTRILPRDFNVDLYNGVVGYVLLRFGIYLFLYFRSYAFRLRWRAAVLYISWGFVVFLLLLNAVSEWFFWQEFSSRYNFIAVDYLVYTTEVLGNISESFPLGWILAALLLLTFLLVYRYHRAIRRSLVQPSSFLKRSVAAVLLLVLPLVSYYMVKEKWRHFSTNDYANSLAGNGMYQFGVAFQQNELDFFKFYQTLPDTTAFTILRQQLQQPNSRFVSNDLFDIERAITHEQAERKLNVVMISVESLSADFMRFFGNTEQITPYLDSLTQHSLFFTQLYSSGTRTVRGLEALSLAIPPTPGQSTVKRPDNGNMFTLGSVLRSHGYVTQYLYGGYSYFDNMKAFFGNNGYQVIDRSAIPPDQVHYENIWGVADEDLFTLAINVLDSNDAKGQPFFTQIMTVSNHRPYTYPEGRIDIPPARKIRQGAVKYTDYAINKFLREAQSKPWFDSTIFVIVADHCAGSAGSVELPVTGYHIPMVIYAPKIISPQQISTLTAQIDIPPTILGLLRLNYHSKFFGQDVLNLAPGRERAFISTYQGLGYLRNGKLVIQSPVKNIREYVPDFTTGNSRQVALEDSLVHQAIAYYQCASWLLKYHRQSNVTQDK